MTQEPEGWVASFHERNPSATQVLSTKGIHDDASYREHEHRVERSVRRSAGVFRAHYLVGVGNADPCELARAAPPWLAERELTTLELPVRVDTVFRLNSIKRVCDLADWSEESLLKKRNFGPKSVRDTLRALETALNEGPRPVATGVDANESSDLLTKVRQSLVSFRARDRDILVRRLGFETKPETLQELADDYGITRERIRQIEGRAIQKWMRESCWGDVLARRISPLLVGRAFPLPVAGVEAIDFWFSGVSLHLEFLRNLVERGCSGRFRLLEVDGLWYFSWMDQETWERTKSDAAALLATGAGQGWSEEYARSLVQSLLPGTSTEFGSLLWDKAARRCHFSRRVDGSRILTGYGRGAPRLVEAILADSDVPLHYTEIAERARLREGKNLDARTMHNAAAKFALLFGRGTYGLARHLQFSNDEMSRIRVEAEEIVCSGASDRQWHTSEILSELSERLDGGLGVLDKYVLDIALCASEILRSLGRMTWTRAGQDADDPRRIEIQQAVISLVRANGHPLSTREIRERLTAARGVSEFLQIAPIDPLVRMQPGIWGINGRDVPLSREEQRERVEELVRKLEAKQSGIHASEICSVLCLRDCPPDAFLSIASQDRRLKIAVGRYVYLTGWGTPRRETIGRAVSSVLEKANTPLRLEEIVAQAESRVGRKCQKQVVSGALQALEAEFDEGSGGWSMSTSRLDDDDDSEPTDSQPC